MEKTWKNRNKRNNQQNDDTLNYYKRIEECLRTETDKDTNLSNGR